MRLGIFGGTFDPPHIGHIILAAEAQYQLNLSRVLFVLTPHPPHKPNRKITSVRDRIEMLNIAIKNNPKFELSWVDINRPPPHYAVDTLHILKGQNHDIEIFYLMGGDSLMELKDWHRPQEFVNLCHGIGVFRRPGDNIELLAIERFVSGISEKLQFISAPLLGISSTYIRERIVLSQPYQYYLPSGVDKYIQKRKLYRD